MLKVLEDDVSDSDEEPEERNTLYYPGQRVAATSAVWAAAEVVAEPKQKKSEAKQQQRKKKAKQRTTATVVRVVPKQVVVYWVKQSERKDMDKYEEVAPGASSCLHWRAFTRTEELVVLDHFKDSKVESGDFLYVPPAVRSKYGVQQKGAGKVRSRNSESRVTLNRARRAARLRPRWTRLKTARAMRRTRPRAS